jgi:hypothetical protein
MIFGISSGIFFGYMKAPMRDFPVIFSRIKPGKIRENFTKRMGVKFISKKFTDPDIAEKELDRMLEQNQPVGLQVDFFYMEFFPPWNRVHINVHYIVVIGKEGDDYLISDCYHPVVAKLNRETLRKGRFAKGSMAPKGLMFYPVDVPKEIHVEEGIKKGLKNTVFNMLKIPVPFLGVKGIRRFGNKIIDWPSYTKDTEQLAHIIFQITIMLEDQGTGGAGFRYIFASFLRESAAIMSISALNELSARMMEIGDNWRNISLFAARIAKNREFGSNKLNEIKDMILKNAVLEHGFFNDLKQTMES